MALSSCSAPIWAQPRAAPAPSATPIRGRAAGVRRRGRLRMAFPRGRPDHGCVSRTQRPPAECAKCSPVRDHRARRIERIRLASAFPRRAPASRRPSRPRRARARARAVGLDPAIEARTAAGVAGPAVAADLDQRQQRVLVAIDPQLDEPSGSGRTCRPCARACRASATNNGRRRSPASSPAPRRSCGRASARRRARRRPSRR